MTRFRWGVATDVGQVRAANQDSVFAQEGFFAVADGMGGHRGGEVASAVAVETLAAAQPLLSADDVLVAIHDANDAVFMRSVQDSALRGMGTTLCVLALVSGDHDEAEPLLLLANVGDSRIYQYAGGVLEQMTDDHSMVGELMRQGRITATEAGVHPQRNVLTRALGIDQAIAVDAWQVRPLVGDRWLLCSDGLFNEVPEAVIAEVFATTTDPQVAANELVRLANHHGGRDNITVIVVDVTDEHGHAAVDASAAAVAVGDLTSARRAVPDLAVPAEGASGASRSREGGVDADQSADDVLAPSAAAATPVAFGDDAPSVRSRRLPAVLAVSVVAVALIIAGIIRSGDDDSTKTPPTPAPASTTLAETTTSVTSTSTTTSTTSTTTTLSPASNSPTSSTQ